MICGGRVRPAPTSLPWNVARSPLKLSCCVERNALIIYNDLIPRPATVQSDPSAACHLAFTLAIEDSDTMTSLGRISRTLSVALLYCNLTGSVIMFPLVLSCDVLRVVIAPHFNVQYITYSWIARPVSAFSSFRPQGHSPLPVETHDALLLF